MTDREKFLLISENLQEHRRVAGQMDALNEKVAECASLLVETLRSGGRVFFCGNGGSAADAQHLAAELSGRYLFNRPPLDAHALHCNTSALTAIANDFCYDEIFARQLAAHGRPGDTLVAISTSGNSANILNAVRAAHDKNIKTAALTGAKESPLSRLAGVTIRVPSDETPRIQEMHILIGHTLCEIVEKELFGNVQ